MIMRETMHSSICHAQLGAAKPAARIRWARQSLRPESPSTAAQPAARARHCCGPQSNPPGPRPSRRGGVVAPAGGRFALAGRSSGRLVSVLPVSWNYGCRGRRWLFLFPLLLPLVTLLLLAAWSRLRRRLGKRAESADLRRNALPEFRDAREDLVLGKARWTGEQEYRFKRPKGRNSRFRGSKF